MRLVCILGALALVSIIVPLVVIIAGILIILQRT